MKFVTNIKNMLFSSIVHAGLKKHHKNKNYQRAVAEANSHPCAVERQCHWSCLKSAVTCVM